MECHPKLAFAYSTLLALSLSSLAVAQSPSITAVSPYGVKPGETVQFTVKGANLAGNPTLWTSFPSQAELAKDVKDNGTNNGQAVFSVTVPADVAPGIHGVRVGTDRGVSRLKLVMVDDLPTVARAGNNTTFAAAQAIQTPAAIDGQLAALQMQYFKVSVQAGQRLSFEVFARRFGSALDPMIRLLNASGRELAYSDDVPGLSGDAQLSHRFEEAGEYVIEIRDIRYLGGANHHYRLRIGDFPLVSVSVPMAITRGQQAEIGFAGIDLEDVAAVKLQAGPDAQSWISVAVKRAGGQSSAFTTLAVSDRPEFVEQEPNDKIEQANALTELVNVNGRFHQSGDVDNYQFTATKGQKLSFEAWTRRQGAASDLLLQVWKVGGGKIGEADDNGTLDGRLVVTIPEDGKYALQVRDLQRRGGSEYAYRVVARPVTPGFQLTASTDALNIPAGGTAVVTVTSQRDSYNGPIQLKCVGLPQGVVSIPTTIGPGMNSALLTLQSQPGTAGGQLSPITIVGTATIGAETVQAEATVSAAVQAAANGMPWPAYLVDQAAAAGVSPALPFRLRTEPAEIVFGRNLKATVKVIAERNEGYTDQIELKLNPEKGAVLGGITVAPKPIPKDQNSVEIEFSANDKAPLGAFTVVLQATLKKDKATFGQPVPGISYRLEQPLSVSTSGTMELARGAKTQLDVTVQRNPALNAPVTLTVQNLPAGVTAAPLTLAPDQSAGKLELTATKEAAAATIENVQIVAQAAVDKAKFEGKSSNLKLVLK